MVCRCISPCGKAVAKSGPDASSLAILSMGHERCSIPGILQWTKTRFFQQFQYDVCLIDHCITSLWVSVFFLCIPAACDLLNINKSSQGPRFIQNRAGCLMRTTWSRIWLTSGGIRIRVSSGQTVQCRSFTRSRTSVWGLCWDCEVSQDFVVNQGPYLMDINTAANYVRFS